MSFEHLRQFYNVLYLSTLQACYSPPTVADGGDTFVFNLLDAVVSTNIIPLESVNRMSNMLVPVGANILVSSALS